MSLADRIAQAKGTSAAPVAGGGLSARIAAARPQAAPQSAQQPPPQPEVAADPTWQDRANAALQGMTFGFADEIGTGIAAGAAKLAGSDEDYSDIYSQMMASEQAKRDKYAAANPTENLALNLVGGLASGGAGLAKAVPAGLKGAKLLAARTGVGAGEGAVAGFGSGREGERLEGAGEGALLGGLMGGGISALGAGGKGLLNQAGKRRVAKPLGYGDEFTPINVADEGGMIGDFYRNTVGRAYGGGRITEQTTRLLNKARHAAENSTKNMNDAAFKASVPSSMGGDALRDLPVTNPEKAFDILEKAWKRDGFSSVKGRDFVMDDAKLINDIIDEIDDPALRDEAGSVLADIQRKVSSKMKRDMTPPPAAQAYRGSQFGGVEPVPPTPASTGAMTGEDLMEARNHFRRAINDLGQGSDTRLKKAAYAKASSAIDRRIREQLEGDELAAFDRELTNYANFTSLEKARAKAGGTEGKLIKPKQLLSAATTGRRRQAAGGSAPLQQLAKDATQKEAVLKETMAALKTATPPKIGGVQKMVQTGVLGLPVAGPTPFAVPAGAGTARVLSNPTTQRIIAGQTRPQTALAEALRRYEGSTAQDAIGRLSTGARRGTITAQNE